MIDPHLMRRLDADIVPRGEHLRDSDIANDNIGHVQHTKTNTGEGYSRTEISIDAKTIRQISLQEPASPRTEVLEPISTTALSVMAPEQIRSI
jgi:hypothetical protein